jgi:3-isopropylmalate/(R)-2-methylmalate dehydratase small subunit
MEPFRTHTGSIVVTPGDNVDTDRIIPARFLTLISRVGFGELLFHDVRAADFALDQPQAKGASVMVVGGNFGCGSSREHAVWAIQQAGFRAVIAKKNDASPGFSDIFRGNAGNCGLLLIELDEADHAKLTAAGTGAEVTIDLPAQTVLVGEETLRFEIAPATKEALINGWDLIGTTLVHESKIAAFERSSPFYVPLHRNDAALHGVVQAAVIRSAAKATRAQ